MSGKLLLLILFIVLSCFSCSELKDQEKIIRPYSGNPFYWQYNGVPVLLLGATDDHNLFQLPNLLSHLDSLHRIGGNYIRNTMSDRGAGNLRAFAMTDDGRYDLDRCNSEYWERFEYMLQLAKERDIIVQIEVWDRFDHSSEPWLTDPYNPRNNVNYTYEQSGLDSLYPAHPRFNQQPFFFTVPELENNVTLLSYQEAFVRKMLSISLNYNNVLYCIDNETSGAEEWATYWSSFIRSNSEGNEIYITQMWDNWNMRSDEHKRTFDHPELYDYIDISQNSHITGRPNWDNAQYVFEYIKDNPRPVNSTKIYGSDTHEPWLHRGMTTEHAVQTFFRNILGGFASSRFHRPSHGLGLSQLPINSIKTIRAIEEFVKMWEVAPRMDLLSGAEGNTAYLAAKEGDKYLIYFPGRGNVNLDLSGYGNKFAIRWINAETSEWNKTHEIEGGGMVELESINENGSLAVITKK